MRQWGVIVCVSLTACGESRPPAPPSGLDAGTNGICTEISPPVECVGEKAHVCNSDGTTEQIIDCADNNEICVRSLGCRLCAPSLISCAGETPVLCSTDGMSQSEGEACDTEAGEHCSRDGCIDLCAAAADANAYIGCEYWPTPTINSLLEPEFDFAVVVVNPNLVAASITISRGGGVVEEATVPAGDLITVALPWVAELQGTSGFERSSLVPTGAYRLVSDVPVIAYQFNPLQYQIEEDCADDPQLDDRCYSYTNDASLLIPTHALRQDYIVIARASTAMMLSEGESSQFETSPGFAAIVATEDDTTVEVVVSSQTSPSADAAVPMLTPGSTYEFSLDTGDVLQLLSDVPESCPGEVVEESLNGASIEYCELGADYDLTGTEVRASAPVQVIGGHNCSFVPFHRWACDHLEESIFPVEAWGVDTYVSPTVPLNSEPNLIRIVSAHDGNQVSFDPPVHDPVSLDRGEILEFENDQGLRVTGTAALAVAQLMVGQDYEGFGASGAYGVGDPSLSLSIPRDQYRSSYVFLAPASYDSSYVNITALIGTQVVLDGELVDDWTPIGDSLLAFARVEVGGGVHEITGSSPFGIVVYGFGRYTSYLYPGGLNFVQINPPI